MTKTNTEVFLPLRFNEYKENKIRLLQTNALTVKSIERLGRINELRDIKRQQLKLLQNAIKETKKHYTRLKQLVPKEKEIKITKKENISKVISQEKKDIYHVSNLHSELERIQEKIRNLKV